MSLPIARPDLFHWFGAIKRDHIERWLRSSGLEVPSDLLDFWTLAGGGDLFESETMFRPTPIPTTVPYFVSGDDIDSANQQRIRGGMLKSYVAFHDGIFLSAVRLAGRLVTMDGQYQETAVFSDLDDWYLRTLRAEYALRCRLGDVDRNPDRPLAGSKE